MSDNYSSEEFLDTIDLTYVNSLPHVTNERLESDIRWVSENLDLLSEYEGKWIAVYEKKVIGVGNRGEAQSQAFQNLGRETQDVFIRFLEKSFVIY